MDRTYVYAVKLDQGRQQRVQAIAEAGKQAPDAIVQLMLDLGLRVLEHEMLERARARRVKQFVEVLSSDDVG